MSGDLICDEYFDNLAKEVSETLLEGGQISVADIAKRFQLPADVTTQVGIFECNCLAHFKGFHEHDYTCDS